MQFWNVKDEALGVNQGRTNCQNADLRLLTITVLESYITYLKANNYRLQAFIRSLSRESRKSLVRMTVNFMIPDGLAKLCNKLWFYQLLILKLSLLSWPFVFEGNLDWIKMLRNFRTETRRSFAGSSDFSMNLWIEPKSDEMLFILLPVLQK